MPFEVAAGRYRGVSRGSREIYTIRGLDPSLVPR
jgi:hypothetical protein